MGSPLLAFTPLASDVEDSQGVTFDAEALLGDACTANTSAKYILVCWDVVFLADSGDGVEEAECESEVSSCPHDSKQVG
mgnify:FL=1